jgi:hypothetical protein
MFWFGLGEIADMALALRGKSTSMSLNCWRPMVAANGASLYSEQQPESTPYAIVRNSTNDGGTGRQAVNCLLVGAIHMREVARAA